MVFEKKVSHLLEVNKGDVKKNLFIEKGLKKSVETLSANGSLKLSTSNDAFVDNFASIAKFKEPRAFKEISDDMFRLWSIDPLMCLKLAVYVRMITRKPKVVNAESVETFEEVQKGQGLKYEGIMRFMWLAINHSATFKANFSYFIAAGSWKDVFQMLSFDLQFHGWDNRQLDWNFMYSIILAGLENPETTHLVRKYMPTIRTNKKCTTLESQADTLIGRWLANKVFKSSQKESCYKQYRQLKSEGTAHQWQQLISKQLYKAINFNLIAGRALSLLVSGKFLKNHNLENKYSEWIQAQPVAKYTGFVFELFKPIENKQHIEAYKESTINAQFAQLVKTGKDNKTYNSDLLVVRDVSGSMTANASGCNMSSYDIAKAMALYFSEFLTGTFSNSFAEFDDICRLKRWEGKTPVDKWINDRASYYGSTNFQSVIDLFINLKNSGVPEEDFPTGILCISDGEFNSCRHNNSSNFNTAISRLREAGFTDNFVDNFRIILWDIPNGYYGSHEVKFEDFADARNFFYLSGYDPSAISFLMGNSILKATPKNAKELFLAAMDQVLLNKLTVIEK